MAKKSILSKRSKFVYNPLEEDDRIAEKLMADGKKILKLNRGDPPHYFPTPKYMIDAYIDALKEGRTGYSTNRGISELREEVSRRYERLYKVKSDPDNDVVITQGVSEGIKFLNAALVNERERVVLFKPYYTVYMPDLQMFGGIPIMENYDEKNNWQIDADSLRRNLGRAAGKGVRPKYMLITNPNNPTGTVLSKRVLEEIVDVANENGIFLISDEIYDEIYYNGAKFTSISQIAKGMPHAILGGASKDYDATGFRIGYILVPGRDKTSGEIKKTMENFANARLSPNVPAQYAFTEGLRNYKEHEKAIRYMVREISSRVNACVDEINKSEYLSTVRPNGAFYIFPRLDLRKLRIKNDKDFVMKLLTEEYIQITRGSGFGAEGHVRIVSLAQKEILVDTVNKINRLCSRYRR